MGGSGKNHVIIVDVFGRNVIITKERLNHIFMTHPEMKRIGNKIRVVLNDPEYIKRSTYDDEVILYYKYFASIQKYITVVVKIHTHSFVLTSYTTDRIKKGGTLWRKK
jgi:hypothetical protein